MNFTAEQQAAIDRREGDLLLDAGAGSGKTRVLAERFARAVEHDGIGVGEMLTITFTDKAAAELRERIRLRLAQGPLPQTARDTESAWISTIHGFCSRILRTHALQAGIDPHFTVIDGGTADQLARGAFAAAIAQGAHQPEVAALISAHGIEALQAAVYATHEELRSRGEQHPQLPAMSLNSEAIPVATTTLKRAAESLRQHMLAADSTKSVDKALEMLAGAAARIDAGIIWPPDADVLKLSGTGNAFKAEVCDEYRDALDSFKQALTDGAAIPVMIGLRRLLTDYGVHYQALKRERSALDFEDLQLLALELLRQPEIGDRYRQRFRRVMVDEAQDTNAVQFALLDAITDGNLFMVGDAQQSIYAFRHADVELFRARGRELEKRGARLRLSTNFRSAPSILRAVNLGFERELGPGYQALEPPAPETRAPAESSGPTTDLAEPLVELLQVPKDADYDRESDLSHWRVAEAKALAARIAELISSGSHTAGEIVILTRATTGFQIYEQALGERGVPTYVVGGRGYWQQQQVMELVAYMKALCSHADSDAWYAALLSPLCGLSVDGLVTYAARRAASPTDPPGSGHLPGPTGSHAPDSTDPHAPDLDTGLGPDDAERLASFNAIYERQRPQITSIGPEQLLHEVITATGYDLAVAALPGGRRRLANIRKLLRLARDHEAAHGPGLRSFLDWIALRAGGGASREPEAPLAGEGIDAVRLMTIHASKGLEFPVVCVADLGRERNNSQRPLVRVGRDDRGPRSTGVLVRAAGDPHALKALAYERLAADQQAFEADEERRLFYVAMTRAEQRLILSGAVNMTDPDKVAPIGWIARAFEDQPGVRHTTIGDVDQLHAFLAGAPALDQSHPVSSGRVSSGSLDSASVPPDGGPVQQLEADRRHHQAPPVASLSYSALSTYERCHLRFQAQYIFGLPATDPITPEGAAGTRDGTAASGAARGTAIHELLATIDLRTPAIQPGTDADIAAPVDRLLSTETFRRIQAAGNHVRREQQFAFQHQGMLMTGVFDVFIRDPATGGVEVIDYKSDALRGSTPAELIGERYSGQRLIYALAALGTGAEHVTLTYLFLEVPDQPVTTTYTAADRATLDATLAARTTALCDHDFNATESPGRSVCDGCPVRGTLCPYPEELTLV